jgi:hypothetical protein
VAFGAKAISALARYVCGQLLFLEERLHTAFTPPEGGEPVTYREYLSRQTLQLRRLVTGETSRYLPLRLQA